jgi:hypothetical protein
LGGTPAIHAEMPCRITVYELERSGEWTAAPAVSSMTPTTKNEVSLVISGLQPPVRCSSESRVIDVAEVALTSGLCTQKASLTPIHRHSRLKNHATDHKIYVNWLTSVGPERYVPRARRSYG